MSCRLTQCCISEFPLSAVKNVCLISRFLFASGMCALFANALTRSANVYKSSPDFLSIVSSLFSTSVAVIFTPYLLTRRVIISSAVVSGGSPVNIERIPSSTCAFNCNFFSRSLQLNCSAKSSNSDLQASTSFPLNVRNFRLFLSMYSCLCCLALSSR